MIRHAAPEPSPLPASRVPRPHWIAWLFVAASVAVQFFLLVQVRDYRHNPADCGERCAYAGMGLAMMLLESLWVVLPGLAATLWLLVSALARRRREGGEVAPLAVLGSTLLLSAVLVGQVARSDQKIARATPVIAQPALDAEVVRRDEEVAGYSWASDAGIVREAECSTGSKSFRDGCRTFARVRGGGSGGRGVGSEATDPTSRGAH